MGPRTKVYRKGQRVDINAASPYESVQGRVVLHRGPLSYVVVRLDGDDRDRGFHPREIVGVL